MTRVVLDDYHRNGVWGHGFQCGYDPVSGLVGVSFSYWDHVIQERGYREPIMVSVPFAMSVPNLVPVVDGRVAFITFDGTGEHDGDRFIAVWSPDHPIPVGSSPNCDPAVAVFALNRFADHGVRFGFNSWRGWNMAGQYAPAMMLAGFNPTEPDDYPIVKEN